MKRFLIAALILLGLLVAAVLIVPSVVDWNAYKAQIAERVSAATGREVELRGDIGLSLLPAPALTVRDARLANAPGGSEQDMARLKELDVRVALGPLLSGHIQVQSIKLIDPTFLFETLPDGRFNWDLSGAGRPAGGGRPPSGDGLASAVSFDQVTVQNGTIQYRDARTGQSEVIDQIDARIVAGSFTGPFQGQGSFRARGVPLRGEMFVSRLIDGAAVQVRATLSMADTDATLRFAGIVTNPPGSGGSRAQGDLRAEGSDLSRALALVRNGAAAGEDRKANALLAQSFGIRTAVEASPTGASFTNLEAQLGDTRATGTATLRSGAPARAELTLALNRLDLDAWLDRAGSGGGSPTAQPAARNGNGGKSAPSNAPSTGAPSTGAPSTGAPSTGAPSGGAPSGGTGQPGGFALPEALDAKLDLAVDGITYNGGVIRQGRVEASLAGGTLNIDRVSALLPGGSDIVAAGELAAANGQPNLNLRMEANADNLRALLEWLRVDVRAVPADRLRRASIAAQVQGKPGRLDVSGLDLRVDASRLTGAVAYVDRGRPAFGARLDLDRLNLDAYLPPPGGGAAQAAPTANGTAANGTAAPAPARNGSSPGSSSAGSSAGSSMTPARLLAGVDANLELSVGQMTVRNTPVQGLRLDATAAGGALSIKEATVQDAAGVKLRLDGQIAGLEPLRGAHLTLNAEAPSLEGVARVVAWPEGAPAPERLGAVKAQARLSGDAERLAVELGVDAAEGSLEAGGTLSNVEKDPVADLKLRAKHPEIARLASLFADTPSAGGAVSGSYGAMDLYTELAGTRKAFTLGNIQGVLAGVTLKGKASADLNGSKPRVEAELQTGDLELDRLAALPAAASRPTGAAAPAAEASPGAPTAADTGANTGVNTGANTGANTGDFSGLRRFDGRFVLTSSALVKGGTRIEKPALRATVTNGVLTVERFDGTLMGGQLGATGRLAAPGNQTPTAEATITLSKAKLAEAVGGGLGGGALEIAGGVLDAEANLTTSGAGGDAMLRALAGQGRISARDGLLRGFDLGALRDRLTRLERPQELLGAVMGGLQGGETRFARLDGSFAIDKGVARTEDTRLTSDLGEAVAAGQVNLPAQTIDMRVRLTVQSDQSLPPLTVRMTGALDKPTRSFEMQEVQEYFARRAAEGLLNKVVPKDLPVPGGGNAPKPDALLKGLIDGLRR